VVIDGSPPLRTEADLANYLLGQPGVLRLLTENKVPVDVLTSQLTSMPAPDQILTRETVQLLAADDRLVHADPATGLFLHLLCIGTTEIRAALTPPGRQAGDFAFILAHHTSESALQQQWQQVSTSGSAEILNDSITPLECAASGIQKVMDLPYDDAIRIAFRIHKEGAAKVAAPSGESLREFCLRANQAWRSMGFALYCQPSLHSADA
jgi:ATP-dependent Clp protease adapter protein ClpS